MSSVPHVLKVHIWACVVVNYGAPLAFPPPLRELPIVSGERYGVNICGMTTFRDAIQLRFSVLATGRYAISKATGVFRPSWGTAIAPGLHTTTATRAKN